MVIVIVKSYDGYLDGLHGLGAVKWFLSSRAFVSSVTSLQNATISVEFGNWLCD